MRLEQTEKDTIIVIVSLFVQVPLALFLGHAYDDKVFMATGYVVGSGFNPYIPHDLTGIFSNPLLGGTAPIIGYPPPWPMLLGLIFRISFAIVPNIFLYNFAIKIPVILGNLALAYLVRSLVVEYYADEKKARRAWVFMLFNPFVLLTTVAWGEFDTVVALLCIASLYFLSNGRIKESALALSLGVAIKPIALPLVGLPFLLPTPNLPRKNIQYLTIFSTVLFFLYFVPFIALGWAIPFGGGKTDAQFERLGGLSLFNINELFRTAVDIPSNFQFLGFLWVPAVLAGYYLVYRSRPICFDDMIQKVVAVMLIFFLTRSWVSEPNVNLLLPLMMLTVLFDKPTFRKFHFVWIIPLIFMFLNYSFPQLFFLVAPNILQTLASLDNEIGSLRFVARFLIVIPWQVLGWSMVTKMLHRRDENKTKSMS